MALKPGTSQHSHTMYSIAVLAEVLDSADRVTFGHFMSLQVQARRGPPSRGRVLTAKRPPGFQLIGSRLAKDPEKQRQRRFDKPTKIIKDWQSHQNMLLCGSGKQLASIALVLAPLIPRAVVARCLPAYSREANKINK